MKKFKFGLKPVSKSRSVSTKLKSLFSLKPTITITQEQPCLIGEFLFMWGDYGSGNSEFDEPRDICIYKDKIYVADYYNYRVQVFDLDGTYLSEFSTDSGTEPSHVTAGDDKIFVVLDYGDIEVFDENGTYIKTISSYRDGQDIAFYKNKLYTVGFISLPTLKHIVMKYDIDTGYEDYFEVNGDYLATLAITDDDIIHVGYQHNGQIEAYDLPGNYISNSTFYICEEVDGVEGWGMEIHNNKLHIPVETYIVDPTGYYYSLEVYSLISHKRITRISESGDGPGQMYDSYGVAVTDDRIYICDSYNSRISVFRNCPEA